MRKSWIFCRYRGKINSSLAARVTQSYRSTLAYFGGKEMGYLSVAEIAKKWNIPAEFIIKRRLN